MNDAQTKAEEAYDLHSCNGCINDMTSPPETRKHFVLGYLFGNKDTLREEKEKVMNIREIRSELLVWCRRSEQLESLSGDQIKEIEGLIFSFIAMLQIFPKNYELGFLRGKQSHNDECLGREKE